MDIQYLTLLERILFLLVEFCRNAPGSYCRGCVDAGCRLECCFCRVELLEACLYCREPGALFCHVECLETREQLLEDALYRSAWDEPCSCSISWRRINSVCRITWDGWIVCGNTVVLVGMLDCMWKHHCTRRRLKYLSLDLLFPLLWK